MIKSHLIQRRDRCMENKKSDFLKSKLTYLRFIYKITEHINSGKKPPPEMIKQTRKLGRLVNIPEEELKNLGVVSFYESNIQQSPS